LKRRRQQSEKLRAVEAVLKESEMQLSIITPKICWGSESESEMKGDLFPHVPQQKENFPNQDATTKAQLVTRYCRVSYPFISREKFKKKTTPSS
jgi:hypothetical protein